MILPDPSPTSNYYKLINTLSIVVCSHSRGQHITAAILQLLKSMQHFILPGKINADGIFLFGESIK